MRSLVGLHSPYNRSLAYQSIVTMKSSPWRREKALKFREFPLQAVGWSLLLHVLVLAALAPYVAEQARVVVPATVLHGELLPPVRAAVVAQPVVAQPPPPHRPVRTEDAHARQAIAVPPAPSFRAVPAAPGAAAHPKVTAAPTRLPEVDSAAARAGGEVAPTAAAQVPTAATVRASDERGPSLAGLRQFRLALAIEARRFRRYPEMARRAGLAGTVDVRVLVDAGGQLRRTELGRSSGNATLDAAALEMMQQAAQRATLPEALRGEDFAVLLPVVFEIEE